MDHPHIAKVYDAGTTDRGRPYLVMEYVPGIPVTGYCDKHRLNNRERLELFQLICHAVQHARQKGIVHRDLKPSNVLVSVTNATPVPKVIDFGVAKATNHRLTEKTVFTEQGVLIGTPEYMSPEQAEMSGLDVDTTTDIYSLGVLFYELLVGALPFDPKELRQAGLDKIQQIIREQEPPKPSTRLSALGATAREVAKLRRSEPVTLQRQLRGDLDWIAMKAMDKDRTRRYPSASEFAADIARHFASEPVIASPPSAAYRLKKLIRRNRMAFSAILTVMSVLVIGIVASTILFFRSEEARKEAAAQAQRSQLEALAARGGST